jgi:hypothetical protein
MNIMTVKMANGNIVSRRIDYVDTIAWNSKTGCCQIWYNYEPDSRKKNYASSIHYFDKKSYEALFDAWQNGKSVVLDERQKSVTLNEDMQHELFKRHHN